VVVCWDGRRRDENGDGWWGGKHSASLPWRLAQEKNQGKKDRGERTECFYVPRGKYYRKSLIIIIIIILFILSSFYPLKIINTTFKITVRRGIAWFQFFFLLCNYFSLVLFFYCSCFLLISMTISLLGCDTTKP